MALVKEDAVQRVEVHDGWIDIRANLSIGVTLGMVQGRTLAALSQRTPETVTAMLIGGIVAWSYDDPVTPENIARLELHVAAPVLNAIDELFEGPQKKGLNSSKRSNGASGTKASSGSKSLTV
jgi:hypothetical protein